METVDTVSIFTKENITFVLALIGSLGTIATWLFSYISNKRNISIRPIAYNSKDNKILFYLSFENRSRLPISITALSILLDGAYYPCRYQPQRVISHQHTVGGKVVSSQDYYNLNFPVQLSPLGSNSGYVLFVIPREVLMPDSKTATFQVSSNRGNSFEMKLLLDQTQEIL